MKMTLAEANKELKKLQLTVEQLKREEKDNSTFLASIQESVESNRPEFSLDDYLNSFEKVVNNIKSLKHKVNEYNLSLKLPDLDITIDEALLLLPIYTAQKDRLYVLSNMPNKKRVQDNRYSSNIIDYQYVNFDINNAKSQYDALVDYINKIQFSLDKVNNTYLLEF